MPNVMTRGTWHFGFALLAALAALSVATPVLAAVNGAGFTTFDATLGGCLDSPNGIDCNHYTGKDKVYMSGGPSAAGLSPGAYFFAVLTPGSQNGGFLDGASGNLSDTTAGGTTGDNGSGDPVANRTFTVANHEISFYGGTHLVGTSPNGRTIIGLAPFDNTDNPGGVYILAICQVGATSPSQCKFDAFHAPPDCVGCTPSGNTIVACKYFDANANGAFDNTDFLLSGWPMTITPQDGAPEPQTQNTVAGCVSWTNLADSSYTVTEGAPSETNWFNSDPGPNPTALSPSTPPFKMVSVTSGVTGGETAFLDFGNYCTVASGGLTLGFWSNKNGFDQMNDGGSVTPELTLLSGLNLRDAKGNNFDPNCYCKTGACPPSVTGTSSCTAPFRTWLLNATATNMAYMLSAQLAAMELNVEAGFVAGSAFDLCSGSTITALMATADASLAANGNTTAASVNRTIQEHLKNCLDKLNNGAQVVPVAACPATFPPSN